MIGYPGLGGAVDAVATTPVDGFSAEKGADGTDVPFVAQEVGLFLALGPEANGVG